MKLKTIIVLAAPASLAACGPSPGSAEWCIGVLEGKVQATAAEMDANGQKCDEALMQIGKDAIGGMKLPGQ